MKANTAIALALAGPSLWLLAAHPARGWRRLLGSAFAAGSVLIGALSLAEYLLDVRLGIDELLFEDRSGTAHPGRPVPATALSLMVTGMALLILDARSALARAAVQAFALVAIALSLFALFADLYGTGTSTTVTGLTPIPPQAAVAVLVLSLGLLATRPQLEIVDLVIGSTSGGLVARRLLPVAFGVLLLIGWLRLKGQAAGAYSSEAGVAIHSMGVLVVLASMVLWTARVLNGLDAQRREGALHAARLVAIINHSLDAIIAKDTRGVITSWNPAAERMYGYSAEEATGRSIELIIPEDKREEMYGILARIVAGEAVDELETVRVTKDGRTIEVSLAISPVRDLDGQIVGASVIARDIGERRRAQAAVAESESRFRELAANIREVFWVATPDFQELLYLSPAYEQVFGHNREALLENPAAAEDAIHPEDRAKARQAHARLYSEGSYEVEYRIVKPDGVVRWVRMRAYLLCGTDGVPYRTMGTCDDVTDAKQAEQAAAEAKEDADRAKMEAEQANQAKSEFLSRMSHELRTPLNAVLGFAQLLELDELDEQQSESVDQILKGGRHLLALIDDLLDISRVESGRLAMSVEPVDAAGVLGDVLALVAPTAAERGVRLQTELGESQNRHVAADLQRLKQVLLNLLSNAIKYNHEGGLVTASLHGVFDQRLRISVSDTGPGIAPDKLERLFTPFDRLGAERSEVHGTGLGLALSKRLAEDMGGTLTVESTAGRGTTFCVDLALAEVHEQAEDEQPSNGVRVQPAADGSQPGRRSLLYIEDNPSNLKLVEKLLARESEVDVSLAMQGELGIELARQHRPDVVLLDLHLPDIPGSDVLARLKADPRTADVPVIVLSADASPGQVERLRCAGACAYLTKPLEAESFFATIRECMPEGEPARA